MPDACGVHRGCRPSMAHKCKLPEMIEVSVSMQERGPVPRQRARKDWGKGLDLRMGEAMRKELQLLKLELHLG